MINIVMQEMRNRSLTDEQLRKGLENEEKSEEQLEDFLFDYAKNKANESRNNKAIAIEREEIFGQAVHYFTESNEALGLNKKEEIKADNLQKPNEAKVEKEDLESKKTTKLIKPTKRHWETNENYEKRLEQYEELKRQEQIEKQGFEDLTIFDFGVE